MTSFLKYRNRWSWSHIIFLLKPTNNCKVFRHHKCFIGFYCYYLTISIKIISIVIIYKCGLISSISCNFFSFYSIELSWCLIRKFFTISSTIKYKPHIPNSWSCSSIIQRLTNTKTIRIKSLSILSCIRTINNTNVHRCPSIILNTSIIK